MPPILLCQIFLKVYLVLWLAFSGSSMEGGGGFDHQLGQTKDYKNGSDASVRIVQHYGVRTKY